MTEALTKINKSPICVEPQLLKSCLKTANITQEPDMCFVVSTISSTISYQMCSHKTPTELPKHVHFRLTLY